MLHYGRFSSLKKRCLEFSDSMMYCKMGVNPYTKTDRHGLRPVRNLHKKVMRMEDQHVSSSFIVSCRTCSSDQGRRSVCGRSHGNRPAFSSSRAADRGHGRFHRHHASRSNGLMPGSVKRQRRNLLRQCHRIHHLQHEPDRGHHGRRKALPGKAERNVL